MTAEAAIIAAIDDDAVLVEGIAHPIRSFGYWATTFKSAVDLLRDNVASFHCIVSDVKMPGRGSLDLLAKFRVSHSLLSVILITAFMEEIKRAEAIAAGAVCILSRPFDDADLEHCTIMALLR